MFIIDTIIQEVLDLSKRFIKDPEAQARYEIELMKIKSSALTSQTEVNKAEAANPNRTWITWRELLGYILVLSISYQWVILPILSLIAESTRHPLNLTHIFTVDVLDMLYILMGMLGLDVGPLLANRTKGKKE